jgi:hypothetical protein
MVRDMSEADFEDLTKEVHPVARNEIRSLLSSLDENWSPFIPEDLQHDSSFERSGYRVGNTPVPNMLEVVIRVHKVVKGDTLGLLTVNSYERNGTIRIDCSYTMGTPSGFRSWREIGGEQKGNPVVIETRTVDYPNPSDGEMHDDKEVEKIVGRVVEQVRNLTESYADITEKEVTEQYN